MFTFHLAVSERARSKSSPVFFFLFLGEGGRGGGNGGGACRLPRLPISTCSMFGHIVGASCKIAPPLPKPQLTVDFDTKWRL